MPREVAQSIPDAVFGGVELIVAFVSERERMSSPVVRLNR
jgi:hypothetical protein